MHHHHAVTAAGLLMLGLSLLTPGCHGNQYDPHLYPAEGPFCEGWYMRLVDSARNVSIGFLFGRVLPAKPSPAARWCQGGGEGDAACVGSGRVGGGGGASLVVAGVLFQAPDAGGGGGALRSVQTEFSVRDYSVTVRGRPMTHDPDDKSPPDFAVRFGGNGSAEVRGDGTTVVDVRLGEVTLFLRAGSPVPWGPGGEGPEGWLEHLPLPIHWFVYSLRSAVSAYRLTDSATGRVLAGGGGAAVLHMEKNWGESFPPAWVWSQGVTGGNVTWAVSGGIVDFKVLNVTAFLAGYRNPAKNLTLNFSPANSIAAFTPRGCQGAVTLTLTSLNHRLVADITSSPASFSRCLLGPERDGFRPACVESYDAVASLKVYRRHAFHFVPVDQVVIRQAALEFGGLYVCRQKCSGG